MPILTNYASFEGRMKFYARRSAEGQFLAFQIGYRSSGATALILPVPSKQERSHRTGAEISSKASISFFSDLDRAFARKDEEDSNLPQIVRGSSAVFHHRISETSALKPCFRPVAPLTQYKNYGFFLIELPSSKAEHAVTGTYFLEFKSQLEDPKLFYPSMIVSPQGPVEKSLQCDIYYQGEMRDLRDWTTTHDLGLSMDTNQSRGFVVDAKAYKRTINLKKVNSDAVL